MACQDSNDEFEDVEEDGETEEEEEEEESEDGDSCDDAECAGDGTGEHAWPTGIAMAKAMRTSKLAGLVRGRTVLELGSGASGVVGLAALDAGAAEVVLTDRAQVLPRLEQSVRERAVKLEVKELSWGDILETDGRPRQFEVIIASDVLYNTRAGYSKLTETILRSCKCDGSFLLGCRWRKPGPERKFFKLLEDDFDIELLDLRDNLVASSFCSARLGWKEFGNPRCDASNAFLMEDIAVAGVPTPIAEIDEEHMLKLSDSEHLVFESVFTQLYHFTRKSLTGQNAPPLGDAGETSRKRKATDDLER